jgi:ADP-heptose:LPS heptosyltransferase
MNTIILLRKLRKRKYDVVVDMLDNASTTSSIFVKYIKSKFSIGIDKDNRNIYTHVVNLLDKNSFHPVERLAQVLLPFGINADEQELSLEYNLTKNDIELAEKKLGSKKKPIRLGINLAGSDLSKFWGVENNIILINQILLKYNEIEIVLFAEEKYSDLLKGILEKTNVKSAPYVKSVNEFASMLSLCDMIITTDTAAVHFASAWKKPCLALYIYNKDSGTGIPWYPFNTPNRILTTTEKLSDITVDEVFQAFDNLYDEAIKHKI